MAALSVMIPEIWAAAFQMNLDKNLVYGNTINRNYQSDLVVGNVVKVDEMGAVTIGDYTVDTNIDAAESLTTTQRTLTIDQQKYFNFQIDSIEEAQTIPSVMAKAMGRSAYAMANVVDQFLASFHASATTAIGTTVAPVVPDADTIYGIMTEAAKVLDSQNVPTNGRYLVMDPAGVELLRNAGEFLVATAFGDVVRTTGGMGGAAPMPNGYIGMAAGFEIWMSNNTPIAGAATSVWQAGVREAISMADSVNRIVGYEAELRFNAAVKGLYVFGAAPLQPAAFVPIYTAIA